MPFAGVALVVCLTCGLGWARPELVRRTLPRPVEIQLLDSSAQEGALLGLEESWVRRAAVGQGDRPPKVVQVALAKGLVEIPTNEIQRIIVQPVSRLVIRSDPTVSTLYLGHQPNKQPEPAGWYQPEAVTGGWEPATIQSAYYGWRYIPQACWIWAKRLGRSRSDDTCLFRHEVSVPTTATIVSAHLDVSADDYIESFFINGVAVRIPTQSHLGKISHWDVTYLLRPGRNLVAARVSNAPSTEQLNYMGFCYRIVCDLLPKTERARSAAPAVRLLLSSGDQISGDLLSVSSHRWLLYSNGQTVEVDPDWIDLARVNYSGPTAGESTIGPPKRRWTLLAPFQTVLGRQPRRPAITLRVQPTVAWDEEVESVAEGRGLRARNGEWVEGRIEGLEANRIQIKPRYGETFGMSLDRIAWLQPNRPGPETQFLFRPADFPAIVRIRLVNNDQLTGALESLTPAAITITPHFSKPIRLDLDDVLSIDFVMNPTARYRERIARAWPAQAPRDVAVIGEADSTVGASKDKTVQAIQRTLLNLGLEMRWLEPYQTIEPGGLSPDRYPVLINLDQNERLYFSLRKAGDGFEAIKRYVDEGGTLVHFARGVPFAQASVADRSRWKITRPPSDLNAQLMMDIVTPDRRSPKARPFQLPPNQGQHMLFVLNRNSPFAEGLPASVEIPMINDMRFRPITEDRVTTSSHFFPIYHLVDEAGVNYGVAMAVIRYAGSGRPHYGVYVNHLLYRASTEQMPMIEHLLAKVLDIALGGTKVSIANLADGMESRSAQVRIEPTEKPIVPSVPPVVPPPLSP